MVTVPNDARLRAFKIAGNDVYGIHIAQELIVQHGPAAASEIFDMLEARELKGSDLIFVFNKVKEAERLGSMVNPWDEIGRLEIWKEVLSRYESWADELGKFREWNSQTIKTTDA